MTYDVLRAERVLENRNERKTFHGMLILAIFTHILILYIYFPGASTGSAGGTGLPVRDESIKLYSLPPAQVVPPEIAPEKKHSVRKVRVVASDSPSDTLVMMPPETDYTIYELDESEIELPPPVSGPLRGGGEVVLPKLLQSAVPVYPPQAVRFHIEGDVVIEAIVSKSGLVSSATVIQSDAEILNEAALEAVRAYRYSPGTLFGVPQDVFIEVTVRFAIRR